MHLGLEDSFVITLIEFFTEFSSRMNSPSANSKLRTSVESPKSRPEILSFEDISFENSLSPQVYYFAYSHTKGKKKENKIRKLKIFF